MTRDLPAHSEALQRPVPAHVDDVPDFATREVPAISAGPPMQTDWSRTNCRSRRPCRWGVQLGTVAAEDFVYGVVVWGAWILKRSRAAVSCWETTSS